MKQFIYIFSLLFTSCNELSTITVFSNSVDEVVANPNKYSAKESFNLTGKISDSYSLLGKSYFTISGEAQSLNCLAENYTPTPDKSVTIKGKLKVVYRVNNDVGLLFIVEMKE